MKGAEYEGSWLQAKMHGKGCLRWPDGRYFQGQFRQNQRHGFGKMEIPEGRSKTTFEGQWKFDKFEGHGKIIYANGDVYQGMVKDGKPHGQGVMKQGKFIGKSSIRQMYLKRYFNFFLQDLKLQFTLENGVKD